MGNQIRCAIGVMPRDYVEMQWRMLQQDKPEDFVIATGRRESVPGLLSSRRLGVGLGSHAWEGS